MYPGLDLGEGKLIAAGVTPPIRTSSVSKKQIERREIVRGDAFRPARANGKRQQWQNTARSERSASRSVTLVPIQNH
jgi:hypothetical protein